MEELRKKLNGPDYKEKLGVLVSDLYKLAFNTYKDIPRGPIKVLLFKIKSFGSRFLSFLVYSGLDIKVKIAKRMH